MELAEVKKFLDYTAIHRQEILSETGTLEQLFIIPETTIIQYRISQLLKSVVTNDPNIKTIYSEKPQYFNPISLFNFEGFNLAMSTSGLNQAQITFIDRIAGLVKNNQIYCLENFLYLKKFLTEFSVNRTNNNQLTRHDIVPYQSKYDPRKQHITAINYLASIETIWQLRAGQITSDVFKAVLYIAINYDEVEDRSWQPMFTRETLISLILRYGTDNNFRIEIARQKNHSDLVTERETRLRSIRESLEPKQQYFLTKILKLREFEQLSEINQRFPSGKNKSGQSLREASIDMFISGNFWYIKNLTKRGGEANTEFRKVLKAILVVINCPEENLIYSIKEHPEKLQQALAWLLQFLAYFEYNSSTEKYNQKGKDYKILSNNLMAELVKLIEDLNSISSVKFKLHLNESGRLETNFTQKSLAQNIYGPDQCGETVFYGN